MEGDGKNPRLYEELELDLGLSTNGKFGVDPTRTEKLARSSSVANQTFTIVGGGGAAELGSRAAAMWRTRSLPIEMEEALRRRINGVCKVEGSCGNRGSGEGVDGNFIGRMIPGVSILRRFENRDVGESSGSVGPPRAGSSSSLGPIEVLKPKIYVEVFPQGSHEPSGKDAEIATPKSPKNPKLDMPLVTTKDTGPNSRRVQGILYRYKKGEEVKIVCFCHGEFLTPKEFVAHGGGGDVEHPLKHIVVSPFPLK